jgi:hypothetical protein
VPTTSSSRASDVAAWSTSSSLEVDHVTRPFTVAVVGPNDPLAQEALALEAEVFGERYGNSREYLDEMYAAYGHATSFVVVRDLRVDAAVGMLRLVVGTDAGLPSLHGLMGDPWHVDPHRAAERSIPDFDLARCLDIAMIAVRRGWGSGEVALLLFHEITRFTRRHDLGFWVAILNDKVLERLQLLGEPFRPYTGVESGPYAGSVSSTPVWAVPSETYERMTPDVYAAVVEGRWIMDKVERRAKRRFERV